MWNIIKAMNYQIRRDIVTLVALLIGVLSQSVILLEFSDTSMITGVFYVLNGLEMWTSAVGLMLVVVICRICGWDLSDKTINYEILSGHNKEQVYFSRVISALVWGTGMTAATVAIPVGLFTLLNGWGEQMDPVKMMIRYLFMLFPLIRFMSLMIFLSFAIRSFAGSVIASYLIYMGETISNLVSDMFSKGDLTYITFVGNLNELTNINSYLGMLGGKDVNLYDASLKPETAAGTAVVSIVFSAVYIIAGYVIFRRQDMK